MKGEISYDLKARLEMAFEEGVYRLSGMDWQVFVISRSDVAAPVSRECKWDSGAKGVHIEIPRNYALNF